jgi:hypothetical protein
LEQVERDQVSQVFPDDFWQPAAGGQAALKQREARPAALNVPDQHLTIDDPSCRQSSR